MEARLSQFHEWQLLPQTRLYELISEPELKKIYNKISSCVNRASVYISSALGASNNPLLTHPGFIDYVSTWFDIRAIPTAYITYPILEKVAELYPEGDRYSIELCLYKQLTEEEYLHLVAMLTTAKISLQYKYHTREEILEHIRKSNYLRLFGFPEKYIDQEMIEAINEHIRDLDGVCKLRNESTKDLIRQHADNYTGVHFYKAPSRVVVPYMKGKNLTDPAVLDSLLGDGYYDNLFTKTRTQYIDHDRFSRWLYNGFHYLSPNLKNIPAEYITEEFLDKYLRMEPPVIPDSIKENIPVEYIQENRIKYPILGKTLWPVHVLHELGWDPAEYYSDETLSFLAGSRKKSARSAIS
jgi:hypothetical protein